MGQGIYKGAFVFSGRASKPFEEQIVKELKRIHKNGLKIGNINIRNFYDGEIILNVEEDAMMNDVFFNQSLGPEHDFNKRLPEDIKDKHTIHSLMMETFTFGDCARRIGARNVTAILPRYVYEKEFMQRLLARAGYDYVTANGYFSHDREPLTERSFFDLSKVPRRSTALPSDLRPGLELMLFGGTSGFPFVEGVAKKIGHLRHRNIKVHTPDYSMDKNGRITLTISQDVKGKDVYFIQCLYDPRNPEKRTEDNIMEALLFAYETKKAGAKRVSGVFPYFSYARQDKRYGPQPISVALVADLYYGAGYDGIFTIGIHSRESEGSFPKRMKLEDLPAEDFMIPILKQKKERNLCIASPDDGGLPIAINVAKPFDARYTHAGKHRDPETGDIDYFFILDKVADYYVAIVDDVTQTGASVIMTYDAVKRKRAAHIIAILAHGQFTGDALEQFNKLGIPVYISTSIPWPEDVLNKYDWLHQRHIEPLFGTAIHRHNLGRSISSLYRRK